MYIKIFRQGRAGVVGATPPLLQKLAVIILLESKMCHNNLVSPSFVGKCESSDSSEFVVIEIFRFTSLIILLQ